MKTNAFLTELNLKTKSPIVNLRMPAYLLPGVIVDQGTIVDAEDPHQIWAMDPDLSPERKRLKKPLKGIRKGEALNWICSGVNEEGTIVSIIPVRYGDVQARMHDLTLKKGQMEGVGYPLTTALCYLQRVEVKYLANVKIIGRLNESALLEVKNAVDELTPQLEALMESQRVGTDHAGKESKYLQALNFRYPEAARVSKRYYSALGEALRRAFPVL